MPQVSLILLVSMPSLENVNIYNSTHCLFFYFSVLFFHLLLDLGVDNLPFISRNIRTLDVKESSLNMM